MTSSLRRSGVEPLRHPGRWAVVAGIALVVSAAVAFRRPVAGWEISAGEWINDAPDLVADGLWSFMQAGTIAAPIAVAAGIVALRRDWVYAATTLAVGFIAWFGAKAVKQLVERGRPRDFIPDIDVREGDGLGLGYVSGHSAVSAAMAVMLMPLVPPRFRPLLVVVPALVGVSRIVIGVHLPIDVVGGWAFGVLIALAAVVGAVGPDLTSPRQPSRCRLS